MTQTLSTFSVTSVPRNYLYGYAIVLGLLAFQAISTVYHSSVALHDNQRLAQLQEYKTQLTTAQITYDRQVALNLAIKPLQQQLAGQYQPISSFLTASRHITVASR